MPSEYQKWSLIVLHLTFEGLESVLYGYSVYFEPQNYSKHLSGNQYTTGSVQKSCKILSPCHTILTVTVVKPVMRSANVKLTPLED